MPKRLSTSAWSNHVVLHDELLVRAQDLAAQIVAATTPATAATMRIYDDTDGLSFAEAKEVEEHAMRNWTVDTDDMQRRGLG